MAGGWSTFALAGWLSEQPVDGGEALGKECGRLSPAFHKLTDYRVYSEIYFSLSELVFLKVHMLN